jgi:hypothetical protein
MSCLNTKGVDDAVKERANGGRGAFFSNVLQSPNRGEHCRIKDTELKEKRTYHKVTV